MPPRTYSLAVQSWSDQPITIRCFRTEERIASFPLEFVRRGGDNTWQYVMDVVNQLVEQAAGGRPVIRTSGGEEVSLADAPTSGVFKYEQVGSPDALKFSRGPEYFSPFQPPTGEYSSTRSNSTRSSTNQTRFRVQLIGRDGTCLVTDIAHDYCTASHIVPFSRPDVYQSILGLDYDPPMFAPSAGLLLRQDLHHAFDRLELSFLYKDGIFYVHFFILDYPNARELHGKPIPPERFRGPTERRPEPKLIRWHYNQCAKARIRGFSSGIGDVHGM